MDPVVEAISQYEDQLGTDPFCVVFTPGTTPPQSVLYYPWRIKGDNSINNAITTAFPSASILNIGYNHTAPQGGWSNDKAFGKLVLEWKGSASSCAVGPFSILNVFSEDNWWRSLRFDDNGNPVTAGKSPCQLPAGSEDGFD